MPCVVLARVGWSHSVSRRFEWNWRTDLAVMLLLLVRILMNSPPPKTTMQAVEDTVDGHAGALRFCKDSPLLNPFCSGLCGRVAFKVSKFNVMLSYAAITLKTSSLII